jgi:arylsulfatase A-like enzyme
VGALGASVVACSAPGALQLAADVRLPHPNFVIFMTDGQRPDEMSFSGNPIIHTPNMDRVAREGMNFRNAFVVNALCAPSRASVLTGMYSHRHGVIDNKDRLIASGVPIFSDMLRAAGYEVAFCGKSHVRNGLRDHYWDYYFGPLGQPAYTNQQIAEGTNGKVGRDQVYEGYIDDLLTTAAVNWLQGQREKPFCLFLWLFAPHRPFLRPRRYEDLYNGMAIPKPSTYDDDLKAYPGKPQAFVNAKNKIGVYDDVRTLESLVKDHYATTVAADDNLGQILEALSRANKLDDTAIVFTADHGFFLGEWHSFDKRFMHEPSIRIPLFIRYPRAINAGSVSNQMVLNLDITPTILELAGVRIPESMQGRSLLPLVQGNVSGCRKDWFYEYYEYPGPHSVPKNRGIRTERYKLIEYYEQEPKEYELYDLKHDPGEVHNLYGNPQYAELTRELMHRMEELRREVGEI